MIKLVPDPTFEVLARLTVPGLDKPVELPVTFKHMKLSDLSAFWAKNESRPVADALAEIVVGWRGVMDAEGRDVPFSPEALGGLVNNYAPAAVELLRAWQLGLTESRVKN